MSLGLFRTPPPRNEPVLDYAPGGAERARIQAELERQAREVVEIPLVIGGQDVHTTRTAEVVMPHARRHVLARVHLAGPREVALAIEAATAARAEWQACAWEERAAVFLRAAELLAGPWRERINAATMLGQSKTVHQAEIDAACEMIDFWRFNVHFAERLYGEQPQSPPGVWNRLEHRPLDGFVLAVTPFNFTSIGGNLPTAPALLGNTVVWKPATTAVLSNYWLMRLLQAAGLPKGVINFLPGGGAEIGDAVVADRRLAGVHFTGSTGVFNHIWGKVGAGIARYAQYPRLVGETGGKDFVIAHASANCAALATALVRGAFEYQGQKCSAASRAYVPASLWRELQERLRAALSELRVGDVCDFKNFMGAVIDAPSFQKQKQAIAAARAAHGRAEVLFGGECDDSQGFFVQPTVILAKDPAYETMCTELFGPVLTIHVYEDARFEEALAECGSRSEYALTGAVFAEDRAAVRRALEVLRFAAGNFYVNDKPTGAVVGQQPFGGSRASGTNDKAGSLLNLLRWVSPRTLKETFVPPTSWRYPYMG